MEAHILPSASAPKHYPIAFNVIPQIDVFLDNDYTKEEMKMVNETQKILHDDSIQVVPTTVRIPRISFPFRVCFGRTEAPVSVADFKAACEKFPGLVSMIIHKNKRIRCRFTHPVRMIVKSAVFAKIYTTIKA